MSRLAAPIPAAIPAAAPASVPMAGSRMLARLRQERTARHTMRRLRDGEWREIFVEAEQTQNLYRAVAAGTLVDGKVRAETLAEHVNFIRLAIEMHAAILTLAPVVVELGEEFARQAKAIEEMRARCLFDQTLQEAAACVWTEGRCMLRVLVEDGRVVISIEDNDVCIPVGRTLPSGQPEAIERRWVVERPDPSDSRKTRLYLRVERHRAVRDVGGVIEQEAYQTQSSDVLVDISALPRVPLAMAIGPEAAALLPDVTATGLPHPMIVVLVRERAQGAAQMLLPPGDLCLADSVMASISQMSRAASQHMAPKLILAIAEQMGSGSLADAGRDVIVDPSGQVRYLSHSMDINQALARINAMLGLALTSCRMSPALVGLRTNQGATPPTADQLRRESTNTLTAATTAQGYFEPALARLLYIASLVQARIEGDIWPVAMPGVKLSPGIPQPPQEVASEQSELLAAGLTSKRRAVAVIHGEAQADAVLAEIREDQQAAARAQSLSIGAELGLGSGGDAGAGDAGTGDDAGAGDGSGDAGDGGAA